MGKKRKTLLGGEKDEKRIKANTNNPTSQSSDKKSGVKTRATNAIKQQHNPKLAKPCLFLQSAMSLGDNSNAFVVLATKKSEESTTGNTKNKTDLNSLSRTKKKKVKHRATVLTTCYLPEADNLNELLISPKAGLGQMQLPKVERMYDKIEIYVKPLLILDVNGILCHRVRDRTIPSPLQSFFDSQNLDIPANLEKEIYRKPIGRVACTDIIARTDISAFLEYLHEHFTLAVWSSAKRKTVRTLVRMLFPSKIEKELLFLWGQDKCNVEKDEGNKNLSERVFMKPLSKVWHNFPLWNISNTLIMDDSPDKCEEFKDNAIHPSPLNGYCAEAIGQVMENVHDSRIGLNKEECTSAIDRNLLSDEYNQQKQMEFFEEVTSSWKKSSNREDLIFLPSLLKASSAKLLF